MSGIYQVYTIIINFLCRVRLLSAKPGAKRPVPVPDAVRKHPLEVLQRVAAHGLEPVDFRHSQGLGPGPVHVTVVRVQV